MPPVREASLDASVTDGIATLGPSATHLLARLDEIFFDWARRAGATAMTLPALLDVAELAALQVFQNFPHLIWVATPLRPELVEAGEVRGEIPAGLLEPVRLGLPTAVCYGIYPHFKDRAIPEPTLVTAVNVCFRNESRRESGLRRLNAFRMREVVALGGPDQIRAHLGRFGALLERFAAELGIPVVREVASDPFYRPDGPQARWQELQPAKYEYRFDDLALASANEHRKFFGEACRITGESSGAVVSTGCVGMGLERWIDSLARRYDGEWAEIFRVVERATATVADEFAVIGGQGR